MDKLVDMAYNGYNKTKEADMKTFYEVVDEHGNTIAIRKTEKGINNWKAKHKVERCGFHYTMNGKPIYIDFVQR